MSDENKPPQTPFWSENYDLSNFDDEEFKAFVLQVRQFGVMIDPVEAYYEWKKRQLQITELINQTFD